MAGRRVRAAPRHLTLGGCLGRQEASSGPALDSGEEMPVSDATEATDMYSKAFVEHLFGPTPKQCSLVLVSARHLARCEPATTGSGLLSIVTARSVTANVCTPPLSLSQLLFPLCVCHCTVTVIAPDTHCYDCRIVQKSLLGWSFYDL